MLLLLEKENATHLIDQLLVEVTSSICSKQEVLLITPVFLLHFVVLVPSPMKVSHLIQ